MNRNTKIIPLPELTEDLTRHPFAYARVSRPFIDDLVKHIAGRRVLELFAGRGMLAGYLHAAGVQVTATSLHSGYDGHSQGTYAEVLIHEAEDAVLQFGKLADILLIAWPEVTESVLSSCRLWEAFHPGGEVIYIGEVTDYAESQYAGCASDAFFEAMDWHHRFSSYPTPNYMERALVGRIKI